MCGVYVKVVFCLSGGDPSGAAPSQSLEQKLSATTVLVDFKDS